MRRGVVLAGNVVGWRNGGARERRAVRVRKDIVGMAVGLEVEDLQFAMLERSMVRRGE